jgi:dihydropyrimidinase
MEKFDTVIRGGTVVTATDSMLCDVGISGGLVAALGRNLPSGAQEIDASGKLVLPGGIDSHCHIDQQRKSGAAFADDFESGTRSAAFGGNTSVISFTPQFKGKPIKPFVEDYRERAKRALIDYSFHITVTDPSEHVLTQELPELIAEGHRSIKIFMTYEANVLNDEQILNVLSVARQNQALVVVHAENNDVIRWLTNRLEQAGLTSPLYHTYSKPAVVEREAIHRMVALSQVVDQPIHIFHVSSAEGVEEIRRAQDRDLAVSAETCTHYLAFTASDLGRSGFEGAKYICSPALRGEGDQKVLWQAIRQGTIGIVSSDHAPFCYEGTSGKKIAGTDAPFAKIPNGIPGIEMRLPYLFSEGVMKGRIDIQKFVAITATNAAKLFGLYPRKGSIAVGMDADIAIWNSELVREVRAAEQHGSTDYSPFEGMTLTGWPQTTMVRGTVVADAKGCRVQPGFGQFLGRAPYPAIAPKEIFPNDYNPFQ